MQIFHDFHLPIHQVLKNVPRDPVKRAEQEDRAQRIVVDIKVAKKISIAIDARNQGKKIRSANEDVPDQKKGTCMITLVFFYLS